jgi:hypothetical protein
MSHQGRSDSPSVIQGPDERESETVDEPPQRLESVNDEVAPDDAQGSAPADSAHVAPYPTRLRVVLLLSLACWAILILILAVLLRWL